MRLSFRVLAFSALASIPGLFGAAAPSSVTFIHEYPHMGVAVHAHPKAGEDMSLARVRTALGQRVHEQELDLHVRGADGEVVVEHNDAQASSPTLRSVFEAILAYRGGAPTVQNDGRQFIVVIEPKDDDLALYEKTFAILQSYRGVLSTDVAANGSPRGITVVITGDHANRFYDLYKSRGLNSLAILEGHDYAQEIVNLSGTGVPFEWTNYRLDGIAGHVSRDHAHGNNVRVYFEDGTKEDDLRLALSTGADSLTCDFGEIDFCNALLRSQAPRGRTPTLAIRDGKAVVSYRGTGSENLYVGVGTSGAGGLAFRRQINLSYLLPEQPQAIAPTVALGPGGRILDIYQGTEERRLWYVAGTFARAPHFVTFAGAEHRLARPNETRLGSNPAVAIAPDGRMLAVYEGTESTALWYSSGALDAAGNVATLEERMTQGDSRRGYTPSVAFGPDGRAFVVYRGTKNERLFYVSGYLDAAGRLVGTEYRLTTSDDERRGYTPSIAIRADGLAVVAYEGTRDQKIFFSYGWIGPNGSIDVRGEALLEDDAGVVVHGSHPSAAFDQDGRLVILYEGTDAGRLFYVSGPLDTARGAILGRERLLDMNDGAGF